MSDADWAEVDWTELNGVFAPSSERSIVFDRFWSMTAKWPTNPTDGRKRQAERKPSAFWHRVVVTGFVWSIHEIIPHSLVLNYAFLQLDFKHVIPIRTKKLVYPISDHPVLHFIHIIKNARGHRVIFHWPGEEAQKTWVMSRDKIWGNLFQSALNATFCLKLHWNRLEYWILSTFHKETASKLNSVHCLPNIFPTPSQSKVSIFLKALNLRKSCGAKFCSRDIYILNFNWCPRSMHLAELAVTKVENISCATVSPVVFTLPNIWSSPQLHIKVTLLLCTP